MLVFVYNANAGKINALLDTAHKLLSPATYQCQLCALSYDLFSENHLWRDFRQTLREPVSFLHRDEFQNQFQSNLSEFPVLLQIDQDNLQILLDADAIKGCKTTEALIEKCKQAIAS